MSRKVLILVENLPSPFDRRVWQEATSLHGAGYHVSIICPTGKGYEEFYEKIEGIHIYRYDLPIEGEGVKGYILEYSAALWHTFRLAWKVRREQGFDVIHACNPPDLFFLIGLVFKLLFKTKFIFDHHDINPELYEAKFNRRDFFWKLMLWLERATFMTADVSIATNNSYKRIAILRGKMVPDKVHVVRSGPMLERLQIIPPVEALKKGRTYLVGYVGVMGKQEGLDLLLQAVRYLVHNLKRQDIHFGLVGGGTSLQEAKEMAKSFAISDYVTFTGRVPDQELLEMLNTSDICVNPDVANEMNDKSTMNKVMEYMALAKPIVQFDLTEGRFSAQGSSLYAAKNDYKDMGDKIVQLLEDPELRKKMGKLGYDRVRTELEWKYEEPKLLKAYDAVFES